MSDVVGKRACSVCGVMRYVGPKSLPDGKLICQWCRRARWRPGVKPGMGAYYFNRDRAIEIYGGRCVECGSADDLEFDHVDNDGAEHRQRESHRVWQARIARSGKPLPDYRLQLLCKACHMQKTNRLYSPGRWRRGSTTAWRRLRLQVLVRDKWICQLCGKRIDPSLPGGGRNPHPMSANVHHTRGREYGDDPRYLQAAHRTCNRNAGTPVREPKRLTRW